MIYKSIKDKKLFFDIGNKDVTPSIHPLQLKKSNAKQSATLSSITPTNDLDDSNEERIYENGWKHHLQSFVQTGKKISEEAIIKTTQPSIKVPSDKNPDYRSSPTYEEYLRSKSTTKVEMKPEEEPEDISKIHYLGQYEV